MSKSKNTQEKKCIFCGLNSQDGEDHILTEEHVIPKVLGGWISVPFVCKTCNNNFGNKLESELKKNIYIVSALDKLKIQLKKLAYRNATIEQQIQPGIRLKGKYDRDDNPIFYSQKIEDGSIITPESEVKAFLKKKIERFEKQTGKKVEFDINEFDNLPFDIAIPIYGTDISFIKRKSEKTIVTILGLNQSIPFRVIAKITVVHLSGLYYPFILKEEFEPIKQWILNNGENHYVLLNTSLNNLKPNELEYIPYHVIKYSFQLGGLSAIVGIFGIKFLVFLAKLDNIDDFPFREIFDYYHIYDIKNKDFYKDNPPQKVLEEDDLLLKGVTSWGLIELNRKKKII